MLLGFFGYHIPTFLMYFTFRKIMASMTDGEKKALTLCHAFITDQLTIDEGNIEHNRYKLRVLGLTMNLNFWSGKAYKES